MIEETRVLCGLLRRLAKPSDQLVDQRVIRARAIEAASVRALGDGYQSCGR